MDAKVYFSAKTGGFYSPAVNGDNMPDDVVRISHLRHRELLSAQAEGRAISSDAQGRPCIAPVPKLTVAALRQNAARRVSLSANQRILAVASLEKQSNDNALIAQAALDRRMDLPGLSDALNRRRQIDDLRNRADRLTGQVEKMTRGALDAFDPNRDELWG